MTRETANALRTIAHELTQRAALYTRLMSHARTPRVLAEYAKRERFNANSAKLLEAVAQELTP